MHQDEMNRLLDDLDGRAKADPCNGCNVVNFPGAKRAAQGVGPLTDAEIMALRRVFQLCPIARKVAEGG